jgi:hypothetical protein
MISLYSMLRKSSFKFLLCFIVLSICLNLSFGFLPQDDRYAEEIKMIEDCINKEMDRLEIPSISIAFYKDDFLWKKILG